jgi:hypothetical protein
LIECYVPRPLGTPSDVAQLMKVTGAEIHRARVT